MSVNNILVTSAGKRVTLVKLFQVELKRIFPEGNVFTTELNPKMSPAAIISDGCFEVPKVTADDYIEKLLDICLSNFIQLVIPTIDTELSVLSANKTLFKQHGIDLIVSDSSFIKTCRDKRNTNLFFNHANIQIPRPIDRNNPSFPLFAKPYDGSLSKDLFVVNSMEGLTSEILNNPKLIFMEYIDKAAFKEFTVDMYYGKDNHVKSIVPRERVEVRAGEINKGFTRKNNLVEYLRERLEYIHGVVGCICVQLFYNETTHEVLGIEINPRFGGGYPLSYYAKANYPLYLIKEYLQHQEIGYSDAWLDNTLLLRYDNELIVYAEN